MDASLTLTDPALRLIGLDEVLQRTGLGKTVTYELIAKGQHPPQIKVGRRSLWAELDIHDFIAELINKGGL